jgi:hypothetical protein
MRRRAAAGAALMLATSLATPAAAFVVEVTTSISVDDAHDEGQLKDALQNAVDSVLNDAIAFKPTVVVLTHAVVMRGRLYVRMLLADQDGERTFKDLDPEDAPSASPPTTEVKI